MTEFDIADLASAEPISFHCLKCLALFRPSDEPLFLQHQLPNTAPVYDEKCPQCRAGTSRHQHPECPICGVRYLSTNVHSYGRIGRMLAAEQRYLWAARHINERLYTAWLLQCQRLGEIAQEVRSNLTSAHHAVLNALSVAQAFVHFVTVDPPVPELIGALLVVAERVPVRGVIVSAQPDERKTVIPAQWFHPRFDVQVLSVPLGSYTVTSQWTLFVDGLLMLQSRSGNTHQIGNALPVFAISEMLTTIDEVVDMHNRSFSPLWAKLSYLEDTIQ